MPRVPARFTPPFTRLVVRVVMYQSLAFGLLFAPSLVRAKTCESLFLNSKSETRVVEARDQITLTSEFEHFFKGQDVVSILGSSRISEGVYFDLTTEIAKTLGNRGFTILTGGGPGIMDAANRGAKSVGAMSAGLELVSPWPRHSTDQLDRLFVFTDLQVRKSAFIKLSRAFVLMPGGLGSMDELFSIVGAIYSGQIPKRPVILVGVEFWSPILGVIQRQLVQEFKTAKPGDFEFIRLVETSAEVNALIER